jgi:hypothetical protein
MSSGARRGGIPGPESRTGLVRPLMTEAEFERRQQGMTVVPADPVEQVQAAEPEPEPSVRGGVSARSRAARVKPSKPRRVQRMFAIEEEVDKKLWLYAIHMGKDRSEVVNDLLRPLVASMVLYDSRDRRNGRAAEIDRATDGAEQGG